MAERKRAVNQPDEEKEHGGSRVEGGIHAGRDVRAGRDIAGRDIITQTAGWEAALGEWKSQMQARIETQPGLSPDEKQDLKEQVSKIEGEARKGKQADRGRLEKLINTLAVMAPDIFEVAVATLANPLAGIGLVLKKIGEKARLETQTP